MQSLRFWRIAVAGFLAAAIASGIPTGAHAENFSGASGQLDCAGGVNVTDNRTYKIFYSVSSDFRSALNLSLGTDYDGTVMNISYAISGSKSDSDVYVTEANYTNGFCGRIWDGPDAVAAVVICRELNADNECDWFRVFVDDDGTGDPTNSAFLACHELGHTMGLTHKTEPYTGSSCLRGFTGADRNESRSGNLNTTSHDTDHIDTYY